MPFVVNLASRGQNWKDQGIRRSQLLAVSKPVQEHAPEIYGWMLEKIGECVEAGWLVDA